MLNNKKIKIALNEYDILFIHETHCRVEMEFNIDGFQAFNNPCTLSTYERPRGGCIMFIKNNLMKYVTCVDKNFNDYYCIQGVSKKTLPTEIKFKWPKVKCFDSLILLFFGHHTPLLYI